MSGLLEEKYLNSSMQILLYSWFYFHEFNSANVTTPVGGCNLNLRLSTQRSKFSKKNTFSKILMVSTFKETVH